MPGWVVILGILGLVAGPTGGALAWANFRTDRKGKEISQTSEIIKMFQAYIDEMEKALDRAQEALEKEAGRDSPTLAHLAACLAECQRLRTELDRVAKMAAPPPPDWRQAND